MFSSSIPLPPVMNWLLWNFPSNLSAAWSTLKSYTWKENRRVPLFPKTLVLYCCTLFWYPGQFQQLSSLHTQTSQLRTETTPLLLVMHLKSPGFSAGFGRLHSSPLGNKPVTRRCAETSCISRARTGGGKEARRRGRGLCSYLESWFSSSPVTSGCANVCLLVAPLQEEKARATWCFSI